MFSLPGLTQGELMVEFTAPGYVAIIRQVTVAEATNLGTIKMLMTIASDAINSGFSEVNVTALDSENDNSGQAVSGLLTSGNDVFESVASYIFGLISGCADTTMT
jgi:hypothetical protein